MSPVFRRRSPSGPEAETSAAELRRLEREGKGRPTPSRREAEQARRARLKPVRDRRALAKRERQRRAGERQKMRASLAAGDEKHLPPRDQGPVRRFCRDYVDVRRNVAQYLLPMLLLILLLSMLDPLVQAYFLIWSLTIALTTVDTIWLSVRLRRELRTRFDNSRTRGALGYALLRSTQLRRFRLPKPQLSYGATLPQRY